MGRSFIEPWLPTPKCRHTGSSLNHVATITPRRPKPEPKPATPPSTLIIHYSKDPLPPFVHHQVRAFIFHILTTLLIPISTAYDRHTMASDPLARLAVLNGIRPPLALISLFSLNFARVGWACWRVKERGESPRSDGDVEGHGVNQRGDVARHL